MYKKLNWIAHIPLIGGFVIAAESVIGQPPKRVYSLPGFWANDSQCMNYQNKTLNRNIEYIVLDNNDRSYKEKINIVVGLPPCAALSGLNSGKTEMSAGPTCNKNEFMYIIAEQGIKCFDADVIIIENAPALSTNKGKIVADHLYEIAKSSGYSLTLYATSTEFHGIPQARMRTFAFLWKSKSVPKMDWFRQPRLNFIDYLQTTDTSIQHDLIINKKLIDEPYALYIKHKTGKSAKEICVQYGVATAFGWINKQGLLAEANKWFKETCNEKGIKLSDHAIKKISNGLSIWDSSQHCFGETMNAVVGRAMTSTIHPIENRSLSIREAMHMMGLPGNFELVGGLTNANKICQNVPVCTASSMVDQAVKFINGELEFLNNDYVKQNNHNMTIVDYDTDKILQHAKSMIQSDQPTLEEYFN